MIELENRCRLELDSLGATQKLGQVLGKLLPPEAICLFFGEMASGKTTMIKAVCEGLGIAPEIVISPTYTLVNIYPGPPQVYHVDFFRLESPEDMLAFDRADWINPEGPTLIEWPDVARPLLAGESVLEIHLSPHHDDPGRRVLEIAGGEGYKAIIEELRQLPG